MNIFRIFPELRRPAEILSVGALLLGAFSGCASFQEKAKKVWGSSIAHLQQARAQGKSESFALSLAECFSRTEKILGARKAKVYLRDKDKRYLAAMNFSGYVDTTQVGVFFEKQENGDTRIEVASMNTLLTEEVARFLFEELNKPLSAS